MKNRTLLTINDQYVIQCKPNVSILDNILENKLFLNHSCKNGRCDSCKIKVIDGDFDVLKEESSLNNEKKKVHLSCCISPKTDMSIISENFKNYMLPKSKIYPVKISKVINHSALIKSIFFKIPKSFSFNFLTGQYIDIKLFNSFRSYSIAGYDPKNKILEIIVKNMRGGLFSKYWFNKSSINDDLLLIDGPKGGNFINYDVKVENLVFIATGVGISPILAFLKLKRIYKKYKKIFLIWGNRFYSDDFVDFSKLDKKIKIYKSFSRELNNDKYVQDIIRREFDNMKDTYVYACGSYDMVKELNKLCIKKGMNKQNFVSDAFVQTGI